LPGDGVGGFGDAAVSLTTSTSDGSHLNDRPGAVVAGDFNRDGALDLGVLTEDTGQLWIYTGNGDGTFRHTFTIPAGDEATGLSVAPGDPGGLLDLLVGNGFGDVLHLEGKGDGIFQVSGNRVSLSVVPNLLGHGLAGVLVANHPPRVKENGQREAGDPEARQEMEMPQAPAEDPVSRCVWEQRRSDTGFPPAGGRGHR
jgi:hypothetical protein